VAAWADVTAFSLGLGKLVTGGELGCAVTDRVELRDRLLVFGHVNRVPRGLEALAWSGNAVGLKLRPHPVACALALGQLGRIDEKLARLHATCQGLMEGLAAAGFVPQAAPAEAERVYWKLVLRLDGGRLSGVATEAVEGALRRAGVPVEENAYWPTLQEQPIFAWPGHEARVLRAPCPVAARVTPRTVTLPAPVTLPPDVTAAVLAAARRVGDELAPRGAR
jgi:dTDP-4-amino-4,6-dideoxygalactose transaminase